MKEKQKENLQRLSIGLMGFIFIVFVAYLNNIHGIGHSSIFEVIPLILIVFTGAFMILKMLWYESAL